MGDFGHELILLDLFDLMGGMAVFASRQFFFLICPGYVMDAFGVLIINAFVAGCACGRKIFVISRRTFVLMMELEMSGMTIRTNRAGKEPFFDQPLSVDAAGVVDQSIPGIRRHDSGLIDFAVTVAA